MSVLVSNIRRGQAKPYASVPRIDWTHPLASALAIYIYDAGGYYFDLVNGGSNTVTNLTTAPAISMSKFGPGLKYGGALGSSGYATLGAAGKSNYTNFGGTLPWTLITGTVIGVTGVNGASAVAMTSATDNTYDTGPAVFNDSNVLKILFNNGASAAAWTQTFVANSFQTWGAYSTTSTTATYYGNGVFDKNVTGISATNISCASLGKTGAFVINNGTPSATNDTGGLGVQSAFLPFFAGWNRQLTAAEFLQVQLDPYCFLTYPEEEMFAALVGIAAAGDTLFVGGGIHFI